MVQNCRHHLWIAHLLRQRRKIQSHELCGAKLGGFESTDDVLKSGGDDKVLLLQTQLLPFKELDNKDKMENGYRDRNCRVKAASLAGPLTLSLG